MKASPRLIKGLVLTALSLLAMVLAAQRAWVCDDAFITFRYADNLANGIGLVFNEGERVEGFSNPLWMLLCSFAIRFGLDPVVFAQWLGIACFGALVPVTCWVGQRLLPGRDSFLPLAAVAVALHQHLGDFASCGLETLGFVLTVTLVVGVLLRAERARDFAVASLLTVFAALLRPDGALVGAIAGLLAVSASIRWKSLGPTLAFAVPGIVLFVPFLAWRYLYFEDLLPNTFYAKSAHDPYTSQGWFYVQLFLDAYWVLWPALGVAVAMFFWRGSNLPRLAAIATGYLAFVVWVGGDFMFARFCLPLTPLLYLALEAAVRRFVPGRAGWIAVAVVAACTVFFHQRPDLYVQGKAVSGIADERAQYPEARTRSIRDAGRRFGELTAGTDMRVAFSGTQAMFVYDARVPYALEASTGLTDHFLAHRAVGPRGHVGHEKGYRSDDAESREYVLTTQRVNILLFDEPLWTRQWPFLKVELGGFTFTMVRWERAAMSGLLEANDVVATDLEQYLDDYIRDLDSKTKPQVRNDLAAFDMVYFRWHDDLVRKSAITEWLQR